MEGLRDFLNLFFEFIVFRFLSLGIFFEMYLFWVLFLNWMGVVVSFLGKVEYLFEGIFNGLLVVLFGFFFVVFIWMVYWGFGNICLCICGRMVFWFLCFLLLLLKFLRWLFLFVFMDGVLLKVFMFNCFWEVFEFFSVFSFCFSFVILVFDLELLFFRSCIWVFFLWFFSLIFCSWFCMMFIIVDC